MKPTAYYNEFNKQAAEWLRNLIAAGHIPYGVVDTRSIEDVRPNDLRGFTQCHFFAGIGVWPYALRRAGWPDDRPVWSGSCPCQPFSAAGEGAGFADERHLWPAFHHLIKERKPAVIVGEQVASKDADTWLDLVHTDLEALGYAFGAVAFPSAGIGAPHRRDRSYWAGCMDDTKGKRRGVCHAAHNRAPDAPVNAPANAGDRAIDGCGPIDRATQPGPSNGFWSDADWLRCRDGRWRAVEPGTFPLVDGDSQSLGALRAYGNAVNAEAALAWIVAVMESRP